MEKEKKIITAIVTMQKELVQYKAFLRTLQTSITKNQKIQIIQMTSKNVLDTYRHLESLYVLVNSLSPELMPDSRLLEVRTTNQAAKAVFEMATKEYDILMGNKKEEDDNDFKLEDIDDV